MFKNKELSSFPGQLFLVAKLYCSDVCTHVTYLVFFTTCQSPEQSQHSHNLKVKIFQYFQTLNVHRWLLILNPHHPEPRLECQTIPRNVLRQMKDIVDSNSRDENIKGCQELRTRVKNWNDENSFKLISKRQRLRNNEPSVFNFLGELGKFWSKKWWIIISAYWVAGWP